MPGSIFSAYDAARPATVTRSRRAAAARGLRVADDDTWSDIFSKILSAKIEPQLGARPR